MTAAASTVEDGYHAVYCVTNAVNAIERSLYAVTDVHNAVEGGNHVVYGVLWYQRYYCCGR